MPVLREWRKRSLLPAAQTSARCTVCHSPLQSVAPSRLTKTAQPDEGVSCENCHGAASQWLRGHTRKDWTYATCVGAGMRDLRNFYVRANTCVACHQNLDADLLAAGHPELTFELDGQSVAEPKHWRDEDPWSGPRAWLVGQAVALREMSWALANSETPDADATARWSALVWLLAKTTANQTRLQVIDPPGVTASRALFALTQKQADLLARQAAAIPWDDQRAAAMLHALVATESEFVVSPAVSPRVAFSSRPETCPCARSTLARDEPSGAGFSHAAPLSARSSKTFAHGPIFSPRNLPPIWRVFARQWNGARNSIAVYTCLTNPGSSPALRQHAVIRLEKENGDQNG